MKAAAVLFAAVVLAVAGCANDPGRGTVTAKSHEAEWTQVVLDNVCPSGQPASCYLQPRPVMHPATWSLALSDCTRRTKKGDCVTGWHDVDEREWSSYQVGDIYPRPR